MLQVRNRLAHDYDGMIVKEYCKRFIHEYIDKLYEFRNWAYSREIIKDQEESGR